MKTISANSPVTNPEEYIHSSLIHEVYLYNDLKNDFPRFWGRTGIAEGGFGNFFQDIKEIVTGIKALSSKKIDHSQTLNEVILPVLKALGWGSQKDIIQGKNIAITSKSGDETSIKPTFLLFSSEADSKHLAEHFKSSSKPIEDLCVIPVSTSYFGAWSDRRAGRYDQSREQIGKFGDLFTALGADEQVYNYLDLLGSEWGISTDGHSWRLIKKSAFTIDHSKYFEFNFWGFASALSTAKPAEEDALIEILKHFYWFFSKESHLLSRPNQISMTWEKARKYTDNLDDDLRARFVAAMSITVNSLWKATKSRNLEIDFDHIQDIAESLIYNTLFIRSCESRRVLPLHQTYIPVSLHNLLAKLRDFQPTEDQFSHTTLVRMKTLFKDGIEENGHEIFEYLINLFELTNDSARKSRTFGFSIEGFKENIFSKYEWETLKKARIENLDFAKVLSTLFYIERDIQLPFNVLTPQQFGSIFESFLEFKLSKVNSTQYLLKRKRSEKIDVLWEQKPKSTDEILYVAKRGSLYFRPDDIERKISGSYYTPDHVVDLIVRETLEPIVRTKTADQILAVRVCDPAMGSGHFLIASLRYLTSDYLKKCGGTLSSQVSVKREILHNCIFGVDINRRAVKLGKLALWLETSEPGKTLEHLDDQLKCTNSLTDYELWKNNWSFLVNGIDAVVGNPPYLGEKGHKEIFQEIASGWLGTRFYLGKMDLFYFFFHLGLDLLKKNGRLGFITTNYFTTASGARKLRQDLYDRAHVELLMNLNELKVFGEAAGQHNMITVVRKTEERLETTIINSQETGKCDTSVLNLIYSGQSKKTSYTKCPKEELYDGVEKYIRTSGKTVGPDSHGNISSTIEKLKASEHLLGELFDINTGIQTGADKVGSRHLDKFKNLDAKKGDGIFVLSAAELRKLNLAKSDLDRLIKPFYKNSDVGSFTTRTADPEYVIYTGRSCKGIPPSIERHLAKFKEILRERREVKNKVIEWYQLQWPREPEIFVAEKIVAPQRSKINRFGINNTDWFASCDVYFITRNAKSSIDLKYVLGLLNSKLYFAWLYVMGKRKGEALELYQKPLSEVPVKKVNPDIQAKVIRQVDNLIRGHDENSWLELNKIIYAIHGLDKTEIAMVERIYDDRIKAVTNITDEPEENVA